jgi:uncharacterized membrane protein YphA (DoxX/SURF4 family)
VAEAKAKTAKAGTGKPGAGKSGRPGRPGAGRSGRAASAGSTSFADRFPLPARHRERVTLIVRVLLAAILGYAGYAKFTEPAALQKVAVSSYQILPKGMVTAVAFGLPVLEMALAAMILLGFATRAMAICVGLLFVVFISGIISVWARGLSIDCGCFGGGGAVGKGQTHYLREIFRDLGFFVLAAWLMVFPRARFALDRVLGLHTT